MPYNIVDVASGVLIREHNQLLEFDTAKEATAKAKALTAASGLKHKIKAAAADDSKWIAREQQRMQNGTYVPVPFAGVVWFYAAVGIYTATQLRGHPYDRFIPIIDVAKHHFPHVSMGNKMMLAYTENAEKGAKDIQTQIKPGTYLTKYFGSVLSPSDIESIVKDWQRRYLDAKVEFARTPSDIAAVYMAGPRSCMAGQPDEYATKTEGKYHHPCEVYGKSDDFDGDLTLAYVSNKYGISARCLVWEEKKQYGRIYGDPTLLQRELQALGYTNGGFLGAKLAKIQVGRKQENCFLMPYIDGWSNCLDMGDHFALIPDRPASHPKAKYVCCGNTNGITSTGRAFTCDDCAEEVSEDDLYRVSGYGNYCQDCYDELFIYCERLGRDALREGSQRVVAHGVGHGSWAEQLWCAEAVDRDAFLCPVENVYFANGLKAVSADGRIISLRAYQREQKRQGQRAANVSGPPNDEALQQTVQSYHIDWTSPNLTIRRR